MLHVLPMISVKKLSKKQKRILPVLILKPNIFQFCFAHDTARVIQCLIQFGSEDQRTIVFDELKGMVMILSFHTDAFLQTV